MTIDQVRDMQRALDQEIHDKYDLSHDNTLADRLVALSVEVAEMANEAQFFKYWKTGKVQRAKLVEECVDVLHFIVSIANHVDARISYFPDLGEFEINDYYMGMQDACVMMASTNDNPGLCGDMKNYVDIFMRFYSGFLQKVGVSWQDEVLEMYAYKNKVNHERLVNGY